MSFLRGSAVYVGTNIINAVIPFILLPILTRTISQEEYGAVTMFQMVVTGLGAFVGLSVNGAANRKFFDNPADEETRQYNGTCLQILFATFLICFCIVSLFSGYLSKALNLTVEWIYLALATASLGFVIQLRLGQWQVRQKPLAYAAVQLSQALINFVLSLVLVLQLHRSGAGRVEAIFIATLFAALLSIFFLYKDKIISVTSINKPYLKDALAFGIPLIPHAFGFFLLSSFDRFIISNYLGLKEVGIYAVAFQISMGLNIIFDGINKAFVPWLFAILARNNEEEKVDVVKKTYLWFVLLICGSVASFLIGPYFVVFYAGEQYQESANVIGLLCTGQIFGGMYLMVTNYIFFAKKTEKLAFVTISTGVFNLLLLILLIKYFGIVGAAFAFSFSKLLQFLFTWNVAEKVEPMPWFTFVKKQ